MDKSDSGAKLSFKKFFSQISKLEPTFLSKPVDEWNDDASYKSFKDLVNSFSPVNDAGERAVKFASDFNGCITHDPVKHAGLLQGVDKHRSDRLKPTKF